MIRIIIHKSAPQIEHIYMYVHIQWRALPKRQLPKCDTSLIRRHLKIIGTIPAAHWNEDTSVAKTCSWPQQSSYLECCTGVSNHNNAKKLSKDSFLWLRDLRLQSAYYNYILSSRETWLRSAFRRISVNNYDCFYDSVLWYDLSCLPWLSVTLQLYNGCMHT